MMNSQRRSPVSSLLWLVAILFFAAGASAQDTTFVKDTNVAVPMRDGVVLRADVWRPNGPGPFPVLVYRTPYKKAHATAAQSTARRAVQRGYAVVMQDVRGRYASDGEYVAYQQEGHDGYDTIEWAAVQPWSNGQVGTYGLSYPGAVQWLAAIESPPHLKAMSPSMTFQSPSQFWYSGGVWDGSWIAWIYNNIAPDRRKRLGLPPGAPWDSVKDRLRGTLPLLAMKDFESIASWYYDWLHHPAYDPWWDWAELRGKYGRTNAAVLNFSAWYDEAYGPHGAINNYMGLVAARAGKPARAGLIIGPWSHGVPRMGRTAVGEREYGPDGSIDYDDVVLRWMDRYVRDIDNGVDREKPVHVFVLGSNRWIDADAWPIPGMRPDTIKLTKLSDQSTIVSDPKNPVVNAFAEKAGAHDYRGLASRPDVVVFDTPPMKQDLTVVGAMKAELTISSDAPDTDIWVKVYDVAPDGTAYNLMSPGLDVIRASYRHAQPNRELLKKNTLYKLTLGDLFTGNTFKQGHRIRVAVMTSFAPDFAHNLHTGDLESTASTSRIAHITLYHSAPNLARLILPVLPNKVMLSTDK
jgi:putative CocE/NonD family hydrolase